MSLINQIAQVSYSPDVGRYLVAARDIKPLELVIWDAADAMGPSADSVPVCLECFAKVDGSFQCPKCQVRDNDKKSALEEVFYLNRIINACSLVFSFLSAVQSALIRNSIRQSVIFLPKSRRRLIFQT